MKPGNALGDGTAGSALRLVSQAALPGLLWLLAAGVSTSFTHAATQRLPVWLGSGVTFATLLFASRGTSIARMAGIAIASLIWSMAANGLHLMHAVFLAGTDLLGISMGAWIARHGGLELHRFGGMSFLLGGITFAALGSAVLNSSIWEWLHPAINFWYMVRGASLSSLTGMLLVVPIATTWRGFRPRRSGGLPMKHFLGGALAFGGFIVTTMAIFGKYHLDAWEGVPETLAYLPMPFLLIACVIWGPRGGTLAMLIGALLLIGHTAQNVGPFAAQENSPGELVLEVQGFVIAWAVLLLVMRALSDSHLIAWRAYRDRQLRHERVLSAVRTASVEYDAVRGDATWSDGAAQVLGTNAPLAANAHAWFDVVDPSERQLVASAWKAVAEGMRVNSEQNYAVRLPGAGTQVIREQLAAVRGREGRVEYVVALITPLGMGVPDA